MHCTFERSLEMRHNFENSVLEKLLVVKNRNMSLWLIFQHNFENYS